MSDKDFHPRTEFNDGEGLDHVDFNRLQEGLNARLIDAVAFGGQGIGNVFNMGKGTGKQNAQLNPDRGGSLREMPNDVLIDPFPLNGPAAGLKFDSEMFFQLGWAGQIRTASNPGTPPAGPSALELASPIMAFLAEEGGAPALSLSTRIAAATAAPAAGDPRWDVWAVRFGYETLAPETRDLEDAVTRALSTTSFDKDREYSHADEYLVGAQSATYDPTTALASLTAGFVPIAVVRRVAGTGTTITNDDFHYLGVPTRVGVEDIMGYEGHFGNISAGVPYDATSVFAPSDDDTGSAQWFGASSAADPALSFYPRSLHAGTRLVGIGLYANLSTPNFDQDFRVTLDRFSYSAAGALTVTTLADLESSASSGRLLSSAEGFGYVSGIGSDPDWANPTGVRFPTPGLPIWGNGRVAGPAHDDSGTTANGVLDKLVLQIRNETAGTFDAGNLLTMIRFVYLY